MIDVSTINRIRFASGYLISFLTLSCAAHVDFFFLNVVECYMCLSIYLTDADKRAVCFRSRGRRVHVSVFSSATRLQAQLSPSPPPPPGV